MSILGTVIRVLPDRLHEVRLSLSDIEGVDIALDPGDGRLIVILEDTATTPAAQAFAAIALLPQVLNASLVYEYSGPDAPATDAAVQFDTRYQSWRTTLSQLAEGQLQGAAANASPSA